jgi:predicted  nucleic acid-binding Zn-ribbon protein
MAHSLRDQKAIALAERLVEAVKPRHGRDGKDGETRIIVKQDENVLKALQEEVLKIKVAQEKPANDIEIIPKAIGDLHQEIDKAGNLFGEFRIQIADEIASLHRRVQALEARPVDITPAEPAELQQEIDDMGRALADMSAAVINHIATLQKRLDACESRFTDLPQVLHDLQTQRRATR